MIINSYTDQNHHNHSLRCYEKIPLSGNAVVREEVAAKGKKGAVPIIAPPTFRLFGC